MPTLPTWSSCDSASKLDSARIGRPAKKRGVRTAFPRRQITAERQRRRKPAMPDRHKKPAQRPNPALIGDYLRDAQPILLDYGPEEHDAVAAGEGSQNASCALAPMETRRSRSVQGTQGH